MNNDMAAHVRLGFVLCSNNAPYLGNGNSKVTPGALPCLRPGFREQLQLCIRKADVGLAFQYCDGRWHRPPLPYDVLHASVFRERACRVQVLGAMVGESEAVI